MEASGGDMEGTLEGQDGDIMEDTMEDTMGT